MTTSPTARPGGLPPGQRSPLGAVPTFRPTTDRQRIPRGAFRSWRMGRSITVGTIAEMDDLDDLDAVHQEIEAELHPLRAHIASQRFPEAEYRALEQRRRQLGAIHQATFRRRAELRGEARRQEHEARQRIESPAPDEAAHFLRLARQELPPGQFMRLLNLARAAAAGDRHRAAANVEEAQR